MPSLLPTEGATNAKSATDCRRKRNFRLFQLTLPFFVDFVNGLCYDFSNNSYRLADSFPSYVHAGHFEKNTTYFSVVRHSFGDSSLLLNIMGDLFGVPFNNT